MKQRLGLILMLTILCSAPAAATEGSDPSAPLDGCEFLAGSGQGQFLIPVTPESAGVDQGTIHVVSQVSGRPYTLIYKGVSFPPSVGAGGELEHTVYVTWRLKENGVRGVNRLFATAYPPDPADPTTVFWTGEARVLDGNRYKTGGAYMVGEIDLTNGSYTLENYHLVLCRSLGQDDDD